MSRQTSQPAAPRSAAAKLFDLRILIGGLFTFYGVVLGIAGLGASTADRQKADGVNINLWMGIGMLVLGLLFLAWWRLQPLRPPAEPPVTAERVSERRLEATGERRGERGRPSGPRQGNTRSDGSRERGR